jgi:hypothetical protein
LHTRRYFGKVVVKYRRTDMNKPCRATLDRINHESIEDAQAVLQEMREAEAEHIDWIDRGEARIRDLTENELADLVCDLPASQIAALARHFMSANTDWLAMNEHAQLEAFIIAMIGVRSIRENQASLAREIFMDGEDE